MAEGGAVPAASTLQRIQPNIVQKRAHQFEHGIAATTQEVDDAGIKAEENVKPSSVKREHNSILQFSNEETRPITPERNPPYPIHGGFLKSSNRPSNIKIPNSNIKPEITSPKPRPRLQSLPVSTRDQVTLERQASGEQSGSSDHKISTLIAQKTKLFENESESTSSVTGKQRPPVKLKVSPHVENVSSPVLPHSPLRMTGLLSLTNPRLEFDASSVAAGNECRSQSDTSESEAQQEGPSTVKDLSLLFTTINNQTKPASNTTKVTPGPPLQVTPTGEDVSELYAVVNKPLKSASKAGDPEPLYSNTTTNTHRGYGQSNQSGQSMATSPEPPTKSPPPAKPPRTFAHDAYLFRKGGKPKLKLTSLCEAPENPYEEISPLLAVRHVIQPVSTSSQYEEIAEVRAAIPKTSPNLQKVQHQRKYASPYEEIDDCRAELKEVHLSVEYEDISQCHPSRKVGDRGSEIARKRPVSVKRPVSRPPPPPRPPLPNVSPLPCTEAKLWEQNQNNPADMFDSEETFINPTYTEQPANIPVKSIVGSDGKLKRYKSDEYLYAKPPDVHTYYNDPVDCVRIQKKPMITEHGVVLDPSGYAVPEGTPIHLALCKQVGYSQQ